MMTFPYFLRDRDKETDRDKDNQLIVIHVFRVED